MLTGLFGRKNSKHSVKLGKDAPQASQDPGLSPARSGASSAGIPMAAYAQQSGLSVNEVWQKIQKGDLPARFVNNEVSVFPAHGDAPGSESPLEVAPFPAAAGARANAGIPPEPSFSEDPAAEAVGHPMSIDPALEAGRRGATETVRHAAESGRRGPEAFLAKEDPGFAAAFAPREEGLPPVTYTYEREETRTLVRKDVHHDGFNDMALLLDHLSLAKEENKEILRLTKESIGTITAMSESIVALKDELLQAKDKELNSLQRELDARDEKIARLRQELEDMQMLTETLMKAQKPH